MTTTDQNRDKKSAIKATIVILIVVVIVPVAGYVLYKNTFISYTEFNSTTMQLRDNHTTCVPFTLFPLRSGKISKPRRTKTMQWLVDNNYVDLKRGTTWLATRKPVPQKGGQLNCEPLIDTLSDDEWIAWSESEPEIADRFWRAFMAIVQDGGWPEPILEAEEFIANVEACRSDLQRLEATITAKEEIVEAKYTPQGDPWSKEPLKSFFKNYIPENRR